MNEMLSNHNKDCLSQDDHWPASESDARSFKIRRAEAADLVNIRSLIRAVGINPLGLDWRRFYLAVDQDNQLIGCGQIKVHKDGSRELASIAVQESWRGLGIATQIIVCLLQEADGDLWLMCRSEMVPFYERFGFSEVLRSKDLPPYFQRIRRLWGVLSKATGSRHLGSIMVLKNESRIFPS